MKLEKIRASTGFQPVTSWLLLTNCLKIYCDDHSSLQILILSYILYIISLLTGKYELNLLTSLPICGFIAQLVEHRTSMADITVSNPVETLIFFRLPLSKCLSWKFTAKICGLAGGCPDGRNSEWIASRTGCVWHWAWSGNGKLPYMREEILTIECSKKYNEYL